MIGIFIRQIYQLGSLHHDEDKDIYHDCNSCIEIYSTEPNLSFDSILEKVKAREIRDLFYSHSGDGPIYGYTGDYGHDGKREYRILESIGWVSGTGAETHSFDILNTNATRHPVEWR